MTSRSVLLDSFWRALMEVSEVAVAQRYRAPWDLPATARPGITPRRSSGTGLRPNPNGTGHDRRCAA